MGQPAAEALENPRYKRSHQAVASILDDAICLFNLETCEYYALNNTGSAIWELLETQMTADALSKQLLNAYDVDEASCMTEVEQWLKSAIEKGVVDVVS